MFKSTFFSNDDFKNEIICRTSKKVFYKIQSTFDNILKFEEHIIILNNKILKSNNDEKLQKQILKYREKIKNSFINCQNLIIKEFFNKDFKDISNLEELEFFRRHLTKFDKYVGKITDYGFYENYFIEMMNKLEHKSSILENNGMETSLVNKSNFIFDFLSNFKSLFNFRDSNEK